jgi:hypothetical protein
MHHFYLAYGEGQFASTATGVFFGLITAVSFCVLLIIYAANTYPSNRE